VSGGMCIKLREVVHKNIDYYTYSSTFTGKLLHLPCLLHKKIEKFLQIEKVLHFPVLLHVPLLQAFKGEREKESSQSRP
jgi:hypothetical protein